MATFKEIASKAATSIDRITNLPIVLTGKMLSATGITSAITRAAAKAIRSDRVIFSSIILISPSLVCCLFGMAVFASKGTWDGYVRSAIVFAGALSAIYFKSLKTDRRHQSAVACRQRRREYRQWQQELQQAIDRNNRAPHP